MRFCLAKARENGDAAAFIDIRSIGSNGSFYSDGSVPAHERGLRLVVDILQALNDELIDIAVQRINFALHPDEITRRIDDFAKAISEVRILGVVGLEVETQTGKSVASSAKVSGSLSESGIRIAGEAAGDISRNFRVRETSTVSGQEIRALDFGRTQASLSGLVEILGIDRFWLFLDEWSETPRSIQPFLADLIRKTILPVRKVVVKIAAIEQRSSFILPRDKGGYIGLEVGADIAADLNLDEFLVFDYDEEKATSFFRDLLYKNYVALGGDSASYASPKAFVNLLFTEKRAFEEFVKAVEGVPRDALNLISKCVMKSYGQKIGVDSVRRAALDWYQSDKVNVINSSEDLQRALNHVVDEVIGNRRARAFLFPSNHRHLVIDRLYDARVIHLLKKNISSRDEPGKRYDAWKIDFGCYVDLMRTQHAPLGLLPDDEDGFVEVPDDDYRSIRRAVLTPEELDGFLVEK